MLSGPVHQGEHLWASLCPVARRLSLCVTSLPRKTEMSKTIEAVPAESSAHKREPRVGMSRTYDVHPEEEAAEVRPLTVFYSRLLRAAR